MPFAKLPDSVIVALFEYLGPEYGNFRRAYLLACRSSNGVNLYLEIIKWHCTTPPTNPYFLSYADCLMRNLDFDSFAGRNPHRCAHCSMLVRNRQMWRFPMMFSRLLPQRILCCNCVVLEVRLYFARDPRIQATCLISRGGVTTGMKKIFLRDLVSFSLPGRNFQSESVASAIGSDIL